MSTTIGQRATEAREQTARATDVQVAASRESIESRVRGYDWNEIASQLDSFGWALLEGILTPEECRAIASLYALGYGRHEREPWRVLPFYPAFLAGMNLVLLAADAFSFLVAWEVMSLASWGLVVARHREPGNAQAGYVYLVMASFGALSLLLAFGLLAGPQGGYAFEAMRDSADAATILLLLVTSGLAHLPPIKVVTILSGAMHVDIWLFIVSGLLLNITPGPDNAYITGRSLQLGWRGGAVAAIGIGSGCLVHVFATAVGLSALLAASSTAFTAVKLIGGIYLCYIGIRMVLVRDGGTDGELPTARPVTLRQVFWQGALTNILNPKIALFFLAHARD